MIKKQMNCCWRTDLQDFRGLSHFERSGFQICLEWFENFRLRYSLAAGREAAKAFWMSEVRRDGIEREDWQLKQWSEAIRWYLAWLEACQLAGKDHRSTSGRGRQLLRRVHDEDWLGARYNAIQAGSADMRASLNRRRA